VSNWGIIISNKITWRSFFAVGFITLLGCSLGRAATVSVTIGELSRAVSSLSSEPDALRQMVLQKIQLQLNDANLSLTAGELLLSDNQQNIDVGSGCNRTEIRTLATRIALSSGTRLSLSLDSLNQPILLSIDLEALITAAGRAKQNIGFRLGSCQDLANDNFTFAANGTAKLSLQLELRLNPVLDKTRQQLVLRPVVKLEGNLIKQNVRTDVDDSLLRSLLERVLEEQIDDALDADQLRATIIELEASLKASLDKQLTNGLIVVELPSPTDEQIASLYSLLSPEGDFSLSMGLLRTQRVELLAALVLGDDEELSRLFSDAAQCEAAGILQTSIAHRPVYRLDVDGCQPTQIPDADKLNTHSTADGGVDDTAQANWYSDSACQIPVNYYSTGTVDYCADVLDTQRLGNAASRLDQLDQWTLSPGTRFDIGALPLAGKEQPFTQRVNYKTVATSQGECQLEMRIHSLYPSRSLTEYPSADLTESDTVNAAASELQDIPVENDASTNGRPLNAVIAFHGGSWQRRSSGALGIESFATQFANAGFVVFAPFYRLIGTSEGNIECNDATLEQVLEDANDALDWVQKHGAEFGVGGKPVLFGQSAGGHLAGVLSVDRPDEIASAVLFYAPTDFSDFARQLISGEIDTVTGQRILESVLGEQLDSLDINLPLIQRNTLPARIVQDSIVTPPMFLMHGQKDTVLPFRQSVRMCNALSGDTENGPASIGASSQPPTLIGADESSLRKIVFCDTQGSQLHLLSEGEHALDLCIAEELCLAGSPASAALVKDSIDSMLVWVNEQYESPLDDQGTQAAGSGSTGLVALLLLGLMALLKSSPSILRLRVRNMLGSYNPMPSSKQQSIVEQDRYRTTIADRMRLRRGQTSQALGATPQEL